ncbi:MAG: L-histidine N(alpha)-methyltransferase [Candidatus Jettenia sp.]|nr:L-histidine N(alpha)-methyltransferase [Candidatus Jettenia sp. AMX1]MBC6930347.1 L-histidine N(alpha)-methyltransferase [Candidatus Jettenia sp.]WKZ14065.1 MAG: L-histidine N(alpha)-methyltransferase [Candidatus Jettenia caeni]KAA0247468.1 MAG: L-histidine N(alpha)-methyltransferase [Candidatus Jettenia sp. AMX1]MCE7881944.1 L-histidine N(alpha)-methyltransferase [Candidatus Jettenia sp. AMX1]MCQ3928502.1 L-histidine N(alpha)-methyltransferase [Candidatus Jettenia sp.]
MKSNSCVREEILSMYSASSIDRIEVKNCMSDTYSNDLKNDVLKGLTATQKYIPSKYFYDTYGSRLFEEISLLPEYYVTHTELSILQDTASAIIENFPEGDLIELGSGANVKIKTLLDIAYKSYLADIRYVSVDVSEALLVKALKELVTIYPDLRVLGIVADFTKHMKEIPLDRNKVFIFFGSTIGNFTEKESIVFLKNIARFMGPNDRFLLGLDMVKPKEILELAYNDPPGITSKFNKNILSVVNRELDANFHRDHFDHVAFFNGGKNQIEMHLRANRTVSVKIKKLDLTVEIEKDETIRTEISRKFRRESAEKMVDEAGLRINRWFSDPQGWFSLVELKKSTSYLWKEHLRTQIAQRKAKRVKG